MTSVKTDGEPKSIKAKLMEIKRLLETFDDGTTTFTEFNSRQRRIKNIVKEFDAGNFTLEGIPITRYKIELTSYGGRGSKYVFNTSLIGKRIYNKDYTGGEDCFFDYIDGNCTTSNMKQIYPNKPYIADGNDYSPPRFMSYVNFISQLINKVDDQLTVV